MLYDVSNLEKLSENKVHLMEYPNSYYEDWKDRKTDFLKSSEAPDFIKDILIYKNKKRPGLFFGEAYVAMRLGSSTNKGWFNSWDWISSYDWSNGIYKSNDPFIFDMMHQFYKDALSQYLAEKLPKILDIQSRFSLKPQPPDFWLIGRNREHHFIEVKRGNDRLSDEQLLGLLLIHAILRHNIHIVWLYEEGTRPPSYGKIGKHIDTFNKLKDKLIEVMGGNGSL
jgi:hypothetical protein